MLLRRPSDSDPLRPSFYQRYASAILLVTALLLPFAIYGTAKAIQSNKNRIVDWLPKKFAETQRLLWFVDQFGSDEILAISWPECTIHAEAVNQLVAALKQPTPFAGTTRPIFHEVISGQSVLEEMTAEPLELPLAVAKDRMRGWLLGSDGQMTCIVARIVVNEDGSYSRQAAVAFVERTAEQLGIPHRELKIAGPTADSVAIDRAGVDRINLFRVLSLTLGFGLAWVSLRDVGQVTAVFVTALIATTFSFASVHYLGFQMDAVLLPLPALIFVLTISGAIHLSHYFRDAAVENPIDKAPALAVRLGWLPCVLASVTTGIGLASLAISEVVPVARFGLLSALGVGIGLLSTLTVWPALAQLLCTQSNVGFQRDREPNRRWWHPLFNTATRFQRAWLLLILIGYPVLIFGLSKTNTSVHLHSLLPDSSNLLKSYAWFEEKLGALIPVEVVLEFPKIEDTTGKTMLARARRVELLRTIVADLPDTGGTFSATTFLPEFPTETGAPPADDSTNSGAAIVESPTTANGSEADRRRARSRILACEHASRLGRPGLWTVSRLAPNGRRQFYSGTAGRWCDDWSEGMRQYSSGTDGSEAVAVGSYQKLFPRVPLYRGSNGGVVACANRRALGNDSERFS